MPWVRFEPTIPVSKRAKTVHALDSSATVTGKLWYYVSIILFQCYSHLPNYSYTTYIIKRNSVFLFNFFHLWQSSNLLSFLSVWDALLVKRDSSDVTYSLMCIQTPGHFLSITSTDEQQNVWVPVLSCSNGWKMELPLSVDNRKHCKMAGRQQSHVRGKDRTFNLSLKLHSIILLTDVIDNRKYEGL
jgi:hypothetical protein